MENPPTMVGQKGILKKHEFLRIIIQCLSSFGYRKSALCLESESGISYKSMHLKKLESQILDANWDDCINALNGIEDLMDETRDSAWFLVLKQYLLECLNIGDDSLALMALRKWASAFQVGGREKIYALALCILSETKVGRLDDSNIYEMRKILLEELENLLPPPIALPERRLEHLVEMAVSAQVESCMYHNSDEKVSLYEDHCCGRDQIPTETVQILNDHRNEVWFVQFSNNGDYLASSSSDCTTIIWKVLEDGSVALKHTLEGHKKPVSFAAWSPNDTMLLTCGDAEVLKLWDVETGTCKHAFGDHSFRVSSCAWYPDSNRFVCGSSEPEKGICMWDRHGKEVKAWRGIRMPKVLGLAVTPDGETLVSIFAEKEIRIFSMGTNAERVITEEHLITSISISGDSKFLIVNLNSQEIHMWDIAGKWKEPFQYLGHEQHERVIRSCFGGLNSNFIASGSENCKVYIWNRRNSIPIEVLSGHSKTVNCVSWNPKQRRMLASASEDQTVRIWGPSRPKVW